jgi:hypothetical protein
VRERAAGLCGQIDGPEAGAVLDALLDDPAPAVRHRALKALVGRRDAPANAAFRTRQGERLHREVASYAAGLAVFADLAVSADLTGTLASQQSASALLAAPEVERREHVERILLLLCLIDPAEPLRRAVADLTRPPEDEAEQARHAYAVEVLDHRLPAALRGMVLPVVESSEPAAVLGRLRRAGVGVEAAGRPAEERLRELADGGPWTSSWIRQVAARCLADRCLVDLADGGDVASRRDEDALFERLAGLKNTRLFAATPDKELVEVARRAEVQTAAAGEVIFRKGDDGDTMVVVLDGRLEIHDGERRFAELSPGELAGELAALDPQPRTASVTAVVPSRLIRLRGEVLRSLMTERPEVGQGILVALARLLRELE